MRVLASIAPGLGHLNPMVPLLHELEHRGRDVEVAVPPPFVPFVERVGLRARGVGPSWTEMDVDRVRPGWHGLDSAAQLSFWIDAAARLFPHLLRHAEQVRPDVIVHDQYELAGWLVGERLGVPTVPYAMTVRALEPQVVALCGVEDEVAGLRAAAGLDADAGVGGAGRWLYLDAMPPSLSSRFLAPSPTAHHVRHVADDRTGATLRRRRHRRRRSGVPLVYVTMGTVFNRHEGVLERLVAGAASADSEVDVVVTVGHNGPALRDVPANVTVHPYLPQSELYGELAAVVCHGGFGTTFGAIACGVPVACAPVGADQPMNAALVATAGAGWNLAAAGDTASASPVFPSLGRAAPDPERVADAVRALLDGGAFRRNAAALAEEIATGAGPDDAAGLVEQVATTGSAVERRRAARLDAPPAAR